MRSLLPFITFLAHGIFFTGCANPNSEPPQEPPNVLLIAIDDLNDWVGAMAGHPHARTPNIDRLAARGTLFLNAHAQAPLCGPSRASLMSGLRPSTTGIYGQISDDELRSAHSRLRDLLFLPEYFSRQGYKTMGVGKLFHQHAPGGVFEISGGREAGFGPKPPERLQWDRQGTSTDWGAFPEADSLMPDFRTADWAVDMLEQAHDRPFFLAVGFLRPHVPWHVPTNWFDIHPANNLTMPPYLPDDMLDVPPIGLRVADVPMMPTTEWAIETDQWPAIVQAYLASISFVDAQVGRVLDALENGAFAENTIVVLFSDHGYHLGEKNRFAKHSLWERATRVPLIFAGPTVPADQRIDHPVELLDIYPTLLDLAALPPNTANEGLSLKPLILDTQIEWPKAAVTTYGRNNHAIRTQSARYIRYEDGSEEFYSHSDDPNEWHNKAGDLAFRPQIERMSNHLPQINEPWSPQSNYDVIPYFREQRLQSP